MSDHTSNPSSSRPGSPVGSLRDVPTSRKPVAPFRFQWDASTRKPGPGSVFSEANTDTRGDYFTTTPRVDIYGASTSSTTNLALSSVPDEWSSSKHGFNAISTVVNNPHKKSAPPKAHAAVPAVPPAELPRVRRKDFDAYLRAVGPEWDRFNKNVELGRSGVARIGENGDSGEGDLDIQSDAPRPARPGRALPPLTSVPDIFFEPGFNLGDPRTFNAVAEVIPSDDGDIPDPASPAHSQPLLERLSRHADTLEQHLVHEIARRAAPFFAALSNLQDLQAESAHCLARIQSLRNQLRAVDTQGSARGLRGVAREARLSNLQSVQDGTKAIGGVIEMTRLVRNFVGAGQWGEALDVVDTLHVMWDGRAPPVRPDPPLHTSSHDSGFSSSGTPLTSVAEDEEEHQQPVASTSTSTPLPSFPLSSLSAFASLPEQLHQLTSEIASALTMDLVAVLRVELVERIRRTGNEARIDADATVRDRLRPLVNGIARTLSVRETLKGWREAALAEMRGVIKRRVPSFELEEDDSKQPTDPIWAGRLRDMSPQDFLELIRAIYRDFLSGLEGMQALNDAVIEVVDRVRSDKAPVDMNAVREEMFDTLASAAELANTLTSRVLSVRTEQNAKLELIEFAELFRETWNFFVRCEVVCRRMIVSLRGVISSQAKSFLQSFHQTRISQSAKLVEDEQWQQAEVTPELQRIANLIVDAAVRDPADFILEISPTVAPPTSPLPTRAMLSPPPQSTPRGLTPPSSPRVRSNGSTNAKHIRIEDRAYFAVSATQQTLLALTDYLRVIINLQTLTTDTMSRVIEFLKAFNSRTCQVVLGAGAMRSAGLKNITAKHLALASQSLSIMIALIPYVRETFRRHLNPKQAVMLVEFDKLKRDYQEHQNEIHSKLVAIMGDRLAAHIKALQGVKWDTISAGSQEPSDYMKLLVKETVTLHKVLSRYLASAVVEFVMSQVFAAINHKLSEEYTRIELPSREAKERLLADARYLKANFSVLKSVGGVPTGMLEMVVSEKRLPGDAIPASPLPMPATNISLHSPLPVPQKRTSLFAGDRIRGMLSRSPTLPTFSADVSQPPPSTSPHPPPSPQTPRPSSASNSPAQNGLLGATLGDDSTASLASTSTPPPAPFLMSPPKEKKVGFRQVAVEEEQPVATNGEDWPPPPTPAKDTVSSRPTLSVEPDKRVLDDAPTAVSPVNTVSPVDTVVGRQAVPTNGEPLQNGEDAALE